MLEAQITTWAEREPDLFLARRKEDKERRQGERRRHDRRRGQTASLSSAPSPSHA